MKTGRPLIFSASIGYGHHQAAKALQEELGRRGCPSDIVDTFRAIHPELHWVVLNSYIQILKVTPSIWRKVYFAAEEYPLFLVLDRMGSLFADHLYSLIKDGSCPFIISTHPFVTAFLAALKVKKKADLPFYTVITDFVLHPGYVRKEIDGYFTASNDTEAFAAAHQLSAALFFTTGIPIIKKQEMHISKRDARHKLKLPESQKIVIIAGGGMGLAKYAAVLSALEHLSEPAHILCMTGINEKAKRKVSHLESKHRITAVEFTNQFLLYLKAGDVLISKAGGVTMAEALACEIPTVIFGSVPGHEEQNADYLISEGAAVGAGRHADIPDAIEKILYQTVHGVSLQQRALMLKRPDAAAHIVDRILSIK